MLSAFAPGLVPGAQRWMSFEVVPGTKLSRSLEMKPEMKPETRL